MDPIAVPVTFAEAWVVVLGLVALVVQAVAQRPTWSANRKRGLTIVIAALLGTLYLAATGGISALPANVQAGLVYWFVVIAGIIAVGQAVYGFLKPWLAKIEQATSPADPPQDSGS